MTLLIRKIEKSKWIQNKITEGDEVSADAITNCIRTQNNKLSVWEISDESCINDAVLAISSASQHLDTIDIVKIPRKGLEDAGIALEVSPGNTPVNDLINSHRNLANLNYGSLGNIKKCIVQSFKEDQVIRFTKKQLKDLINGAIESGRIHPNSLDPSLKEKLLK